jgi:hypothetical protein
LVSNPYPLILETFSDQRKKLSSPNPLRLAITLGVVHIVLLFVAAITFLLKLFQSKKQQRKIWFWCKHYPPNATSAYFVPNGFIMIELLQISGCTCFVLFVMCFYWLVKHPESIPVYVNAGIMFLHAVALVPGGQLIEKLGTLLSASSGLIHSVTFLGAIAFWLSGWSAFYVVCVSCTIQFFHVRKKNQ